MIERDQKTIALVASRLLAAYMTTQRQGGDDTARPLFNYVGGHELYDESKHAEGVEHLFFTFADLADRLIICCDPEAIDAWNSAGEPE